MTLNRDKCEFRKNTLKFFGHVFSEAGMTPDPDKVSALNDTAAPTNASELRSFLGLASYCSRYIRDFASVSEPLRKLTHQNEKFEWTSDCQRAFETIRERVARAKNMAYYDPN
ncbi:uncharacterized protein [Ambystoma mexicanum]|uniref:uncharacterized protein n=1 Tax=Ambystoma mexicanum TaxID=8296 RepID=UPI0037E98657